MRRLAPFFGIALLLAGCGGAKTVSPTAKTVIGSVPTSTQASVPAGDAKSGATLFTSSGCGGCHKFTPAGTNKTIGPDLDKLAQYANQANQGSEAQFAFAGGAAQGARRLSPADIATLVGHRAIFATDVQLGSYEQAPTANAGSLVCQVDPTYHFYCPTTDQLDRLCFTWTDGESSGPTERV